MTSHDVVSRVRRLAGTRRVGHAGTLDPMATGVLVVGVEKATRLLGYLSLSQKEYAATIRLGQSTTTDDAEGEPAGGAPATSVSRSVLDAEVAKLTGEISQVPPGVSAIKVGGKRAYKLTREGATPELAPRPVTVYDFTVTSVRPSGSASSRGDDPPDTLRTPGDWLDVDAIIRCSSGTYIRALARDLGRALGTGGHLVALRRTSVGAYSIAQARTLDLLSERLVVTPLAQAAAAAFPRVDLPADAARRLAHGARIPAPPPPPSSTPTPPAAAPAPPAASTSTPTPPAASTSTPTPTPPAASTSAAAPVPPPPAAAPPATPMAAFAPDGTLIALVTEESGLLVSLAVFADPPPAG
jgi:tRNA pseudouridine55 synthase